MRWRDDRGAATVTTAIMAGAWVVMLAFVVVGGGRIRALQRADNIAAEAARAAGSAIDTGLAVPGQAQVVDPLAAEAAAKGYLDEVDAEGKIVFDPDGKTLTITVTIQYQNPTSMAFLGGSTWDAVGVARVRLLVE
ncbi:MAG TPA: hypothetical protein VF062_19075 [Candidatus Limnocylindrales bacterium]